jgi:hypothetical protein
MLCRHLGVLYRFSVCLQLYVIGPHIVLTRRSTLTVQHIQQTAAAAAAATAASDGGSITGALRPAVVLLQRVSAVPLSAADAAHGCSNSTSNQQGMPETSLPVSSQGHTAAAAVAPAGAVRQPAVAHIQAATEGAAGTALADASVAGDAAAPPLWAMQQLASFLRQELQLNLFNVDIIAPQQQQQQQQQPESATEHSDSVRECGGAGNSSKRQFLVVDVNFFPGFDKVPGAEQLFADYLASLKDAERSQH